MDKKQKPVAWLIEYVYPEAPKRLRDICRREIVEDKKYAAGCKKEGYTVIPLVPQD